jgi:hypothetical protein
MAGKNFSLGIFSPLNLTDTDAVTKSKLNAIKMDAVGKNAAGSFAGKIPHG